MKASLDLRRAATLACCCLSFIASGASSPEPAWIPFAPEPDGPAEALLDLRSLNEPIAGASGWIESRGSHFIHPGTHEPVRFWAVNGPPGELRDPDGLHRAARVLAKRGVNLIRIHGAVFNKEGEPDPAKVQHLIDVVDAMKQEGIYSTLSIYFPLWFTPKSDLSWLEGYDGSKHPFAALLFNPGFQAKYRAWWTAVLTTPGQRTHRTLAEEAAVFGAEIQNEDSFFFWTFNEGSLPEAQWRMLETLFADWLKKRHGSLEAATARWNGVKAKRDDLAAGRVGFRPLWNMFNERTQRDQDTTLFLAELQRSFYSEASAHLRKLGFKGLVTASNWATASPEVFGPIEKWTYTAADFIDRHGYFSCHHKGEASEWSLRDGHICGDRSALRFDPVEAGKPRSFNHPVMDVHYDGKPSMISETTWTRPNRYRSEAPLYLAAYGALQDSDAIVHFAFDGADWNVKPNFWMQPWTLMSPAMMGQFPAAALIYRQRLLTTGPVVASVDLNLKETLELKGTPLPQDASFDELRLKDVPAGNDVRPGQRLDPLLHYVGRTEVQFGDKPRAIRLNAPPDSIDHAGQRVRSATGELLLDYGKGILTLNAARAQGVSGNLREAGRIELKDLSLECDLDLAHIVLVPLDAQPLATSRKMLLQVMSEEQNGGWKSEPQADGLYRVASVGTDPWMIRALRGTITFKRADAGALECIPLDANGRPKGSSTPGKTLHLQPGVIYYLVRPRTP